MSLIDALALLIFRFTGLMIITALYAALAQDLITQEWWFRGIMIA
jgi:hypothetical protein